MKLALLLLLSIGTLSLSASAQTKTTETTTSFSIADSASFTGKYKYEDLPFDYMTISVRDNKLYYEGGEYSGSLTPLPDKKDAFDANNGAAVFTFIRNDQNKITDLKIEYMGQTYQGKREEKKG